MESLLPGSCRMQIHSSLTIHWWAWHYVNKTMSFQCIALAFTAWLKEVFLKPKRYFDQKHKNKTFRPKTKNDFLPKIPKIITGGNPHFPNWGINSPSNWEADVLKCWGVGAWPCSCYHDVRSGMMWSWLPNNANTSCWWKWGLHHKHEPNNM